MRPADLLGRLGRLRFPLSGPEWPAGVDRPPPERHVGLDYDHEWSRRYPARLVRAMVVDNVTRPLSRVLAPTTIRGTEYLAHVEPPVIFAANHTSHLDTPLLLTTLPVRFRHRTVVGAAADYFFDRRWKAALWSLTLAAVPIERARLNRRSTEVAAELLAEKWNLVIFPEGGRSPDGWAQDFSPAAAALLAKRSGAAVVPVYLRGTHRILPKRADGGGGSGTKNKGRPFRRGEVSVVFGPPMRPSEDEDARRFGARIEGAVELLAREVATDWWQARRAGPGAPSALHGPEAVPWRRAWALGALERPPKEPSWPDVKLASLTGRGRPRPPRRPKRRRTRRP
jgi:1-acyl-sn-glycerol-3-phosphate acyltransferase